jgi:peptide/nickel transport system permease protein
VAPPRYAVLIGAGGASRWVIGISGQAARFDSKQLKRRSVGTYIIRRILYMLIVLLIVSALVFILVRLLPGDPILVYLTQQDVESLTIEQVAKVRHEFGLDRPLVIQYGRWLGGILTGDLGISVIRQTPVTVDIRQRLPITLHLGVMAFLVSIVIGIPGGVIAAVRRGRWMDQVVTTLGNLGVTIPSFWLAIFLIYIFGLKLGLLPIFGYNSPFRDFWLNAKEIILPVFCLAIPPIATDMRLTRSSMLEVMRQDYIRTAWSKGLRERWVIIRHGLKNGLIPVITMKGMSIIMIFGGSVFIETVFSIPGMGRLLVEAVRSLDYGVIQAVIFIMAIIVSVVNLLIDISWGWLDPRVRYE